MADFKPTSYSDGFGIFNKVNETTFGKTSDNKLRLFMLNTENKLFNYDELYEYLLPNIAHYVFSRNTIHTAQQDPKKQMTILVDALSHLREISSKKDKGAGGELGEILLYLFLEQDLHAPKLLSKVEMKTNPKDYVKGSDGIHFKFRTNDSGKKVLQLVIGESKIRNSLESGIKDAFSSIDTYLTSNIHDRTLLDTHLMNQMVDEEEAKELKEYILSVPRQKKETIFGILIGYTIDYTGDSDTNDQYDVNVIQENIKQVLAYKQTILDLIDHYKVNNYEFNFYFLPFHNAFRDRKAFIDQLTKAHPHFSWEEIRNG